VRAAMSRKLTSMNEEMHPQTAQFFPATAGQDLFRRCCAFASSVAGH